METKDTFSNTKATLSTETISPHNPNDTEGFVIFQLPRKVPIALLFAFIIHIVVGVWVVSSFYFGQKELQTQFKENITQLSNEIGEIKSIIYTRNEALLQFEAVRQENARQDQEIREIRSRMNKER